MKRFKNVDLWQYFRLNYLSKNVVHNGKGKIIPFRGTHIEMEENSKLILNDDSLEFCLNKVRGSRAETLVRLHKNAIWDAKGYCGLNYGVTLEINEDAKLESGFFTLNSNSTIIVNKKVTVGNDVMIGRNVIIYDSDFHTINDNDVFSEPVEIGDHVWIATNAMVLKGVHIGNGSVIAAGAIVTEDVSEKALVASNSKQRILSESTEWKR